MIYKTSAAYSFGKSKSKRDESNLLNKTLLTNPDAGKYFKDILTKPTGGYKFSKEQKLKGPKRTAPSPTKYNTNKTTMGEGVPKYSMNKTERETMMDKAIKRTKKKNNPSPGKYNLTEENYEKTVFNKTIAQHFSKEDKLKLVDNKVPGVGKYNAIYTTDFGKGNKNKFSMTSTKRKTIVDTSKTSSSVKHQGDIVALDPGHYEIKSTFGTGGTKPAIRGKPKYIKPFDVPGPGKYNESEAKIKTLKTEPMTSLGFGNKVDITEKERKKDVPGFKYNIPRDFDDMDKKKIKTVTFVKGERMPKIKSTTPGPGAYYIPCSFGNVDDPKFRKV